MINTQSKQLLLSSVWQTCTSLPHPHLPPYWQIATTWNGDLGSLCLAHTNTNPWTNSKSWFNPPFHLYTCNEHSKQAVTTLSWGELVHPPNSGKLHKWYSVTSIWLSWIPIHALTQNLGSSIPFHLSIYQNLGEVHVLHTAKSNDFACSS